MTSSLLRRPSGLSQPNVSMNSGVIAALGETVELALSGHDMSVVEITGGPWVGTIQFQTLQFGGSWTGTPFYSLASGSGGVTFGQTTGTNTTRIGFAGGLVGVRAAATAWTSGEASVSLRAVRTSEIMRAVHVINNPRGVFRSATSNPSAAADGADVSSLATALGAQVIYPWSIPQATWSFASAAGGITTTADVALASAAGAGLRRYLTSLTLSNNSATATDVQIKDGSTVIARYFLPSNAPNVPITFECPLFTTANQALNIACGTTAAAVFANAQGFTAP